MGTTELQEDYNIDEEALIDLGSFQQKEGLQNVYLGVNLAEAQQGKIMNVLRKSVTSLVMFWGRLTLSNTELM